MTNSSEKASTRLGWKPPADRLRFASVLLFAAGAVLMPLGVFAVGYGWYGAARARYAYDQFPYLLSGGLVGVCLTTIGGFLYFGAWIARGQADQRAAAEQLQDHLQALPERLARQLAAVLTGDDDGGVPVVAGADGALVHRRDCRLVAERDDLRPVVASDADLALCRVCHPVATPHAARSE